MTTLRHRETAARIPSLDGLRAISISLVLVGHLAGSRFFLPEKWLQPFGDLGYLGVRVFFVISGFLITSLLLDEYHITGRISLQRFYFRRTMRIFPAFYVYLLAIAGLAGFRVIALKPGDLLHAATYTMNYHYDRSWWVGHLWSLAVEEQFYLLWPALIVVAGIKRAMSIAAITVLVCPLLRVVLLVFIPGRHPWMNELFATTADAIAIGCLLAGFRRQLIACDWYKKTLESRWFILALVLVLAANSYPGGRIHGGIIDLLINVCVAVAIDRYVRMPETPSGRILNSPALTYTGMLSYSIYLWQQPLLRHGQTHHLLAAFPLSLLCVIGLAWLSYRFVETPFLNVRKRLERSFAIPPVAVA
jgi:peptidoglycan/LPS O-acetylase OafA/YrhL